MPNLPGVDLSDRQSMAQEEEPILTTGFVLWHVGTSTVDDIREECTNGNARAGAEVRDTRSEGRKP